MSYREVAMLVTAQYLFIWTCEGCGALVNDKEKHDEFHNNLNETTQLANWNRLIG